MSNWENVAQVVSAVYGSFVDWEERFFLCPECGEPVYECDWTDEDFLEENCPICGFVEG